jgi:hypothetical protein
MPTRTRTRTKKSGKMTRKSTLSPIKEELSPIKEETSAQLRSMSKGSKRSKGSKNKRKTASRKIGSFMKKHRTKIQLRFLNTICSDSNVCIAFGKEVKKIRGFFEDFKFGLLSEAPRVVGSSTNGTVQLLTFKKDEYVANAIFKTSNREDADNLMYEAMVGRFINRQKIRFPCFLETYGIFNNGRFYPRGQIKDINHYRKIDMNKDTLIKSCEEPLNVGIMIENIKESKTLNDTISELGFEYTNFMNTQILYILYQIYAPLSILSEVFTHYDLHHGNVMLYEPVKGKHIEYHYHYPDHDVSFNSKYLVKIIDYGRSFFIDEETGYNPTDIYRDLCDSDATTNCNDCGENSGFTWLNPTPAYNISSQKRNKSHDLRLLHMIKDYDLDYNRDLLGLIHTTRYIHMYGSPEIRQPSPYGIGNVNDASRRLEQLMEREFFKTNNQYDPSLRLGVMHIYSDGRPMEYISL